jgi:hypothetical protein
MSESTDSTPAVESVSEQAATETAPESTSGYGVTDPGYETVTPVEDELAALRAENTKKPIPSDETPPDDASSEVSDDAGSEDTDDSAEETGETPAVESDASTDSADEISDELLDRAIAVGFELDDVKDLTDAKAFEQAVARVEKLQARLQGKKQGDAPDAETAQSESPAPDWDQMIEDGHDPDIIALQKANYERTVAAEAEVRRLREAEQARAAQAQIAAFDSQLDRLGDDYVSLFGKGSADELRETNRKAFDNRGIVFDKMNVLRRGYEASGQKVPPESVLIREAVQASFYEQTQEIVRNSIKKQIKNAGSQALSRPRSGGEKALTGQAKALAIEEEFWKKHS